MITKIILILLATLNVFLFLKQLEQGNYICSILNLVACVMLVIAYTAMKHSEKIENEKRK